MLLELPPNCECRTDSVLRVRECEKKSSSSATSSVTVGVKITEALEGRPNVERAGEGEAVGVDTEDEVCSSMDESDRAFGALKMLSSSTSSTSLSLSSLSPPSPPACAEEAAARLPFGVESAEEPFPAVPPIPPPAPLCGELLGSTSAPEWCPILMDLRWIASCSPMLSK